MTQPPPAQPPQYPQQPQQYQQAQALPKFEILHPGAYPILLYRLSHGETFKASAGAMVAMDAELKLTAKMEGGFIQAMARKFLTSENVFFQRLTADKGPGTAYFAPTFPGGIVPVQLDGSFRLRIQKGGYLASTDGVTLETISQGLSKGLFSKEGFFILRAGGAGLLFLSSYGDIHVLDLPPGKQMFIDNGHLVAWDETMPYSIRLATKSVVTSLTSGEGLVCTFTGPGRVYLQTRSPQAVKPAK
ncbi:MAG: TIGR00266 family protein [Deltaproteobacteria bacterium]|nr:TIGR00266 family protein [Deltaproteobacteria bacterium]